MNSIAAMLRPVLAAVSRARLSVLIYHRVLEEPDELLPGAPCDTEFERTMQSVKELFNVIPLSEAVAGLRTGKLPPRSLSITFDDGYANNATVAAPILRRLGLHATFFVATGFLNGGRMFNDTVIEAVRGFTGHELDLRSIGLSCYRMKSIEDRRASISAILSGVKYLGEERRVAAAEDVARLAVVRPRTDLMMSSEQVRLLDAEGFEIGGHTVNHPMLAQLDPASAKREIADGRDALEALTGRKVRLFAYPNGRPEKDYTAASVEVVRELGFLGAVSTSPGAARVGADPYQIPRFTPWQTVPWRFAVQMASNVVGTAPVYAR